MLQIELRAHDTAVAPENSLRLGLIVLGALADLARTDAMSVLSAEGASVSEDALSAACPASAPVSAAAQVAG